MSPPRPSARRSCPWWIWRAANGCVRESPADGNQALTWGEIRQGRLDNGVNDVYIYIYYIYIIHLNYTFILFTYIKYLYCIYIYKYVYKNIYYRFKININMFII